MNRQKLSKLFGGILIGVVLVSILAFAPTAVRYFNGAVLINGISDEVQLRVQGYTTQTNVIFTVEQSDGTDVLTITNDGAISSSAAGTSGDTTINGILLVDGQADSNQITVQGYTTQTTNLLTLEQSDGTDVLTVTNAGALNVSSTIDYDGLLVGSTTTVTATDGQTITPTTSLYILDAASEITITLAACSNNDQQLRLFGNDAQTINVNDTNIRTTDGNAIAFGQYDLVEWNCVSTEWILAYETNNQ